MNIPFFDLRRQYALIKDEVEPAVLDCMAGCGYIEGKEVSALESDMAEYLGVKHVITCGSGTAALQIALRACGVNPGDEVITTAFSFFATAEAIASVGATPVFADVKKDDYNIDPASVEKLITSKTKAILPVHIFGSPADIKSLRAIAEKHDLKIVEDACQAIGSSEDGIFIGGLGDVAAFSFYPTKNLGAFGDGGMMTTNDDDLALICRTLKAHASGKNGFAAANILGKDIGTFTETAEEATELYDPYKYYNYLIGDNSRLDCIQAAVLDIKLRHLDQFNAKRAAIAEKYNDKLADLPLQLPTPADGVCHCWHQYVLLSEDKDDLIAFLGEKGIGTGSFYPVPLHLQKAFADLNYQEGDLPVAEQICKQSVCLPVFPELMEEETDYIIEMIHEFYK